ncbi:alpha-ketoglutarate-dependent dioxygenase AlkB [Luteolibacter sp. LG18]|uniref:alpha-ketoglutarate-dependent dioxygenase AlkB family protein n=1 Tax=Luteolibacter sp. LG18 TaxID=2819286 RepID=UPI002B2A8FDC|nr:DNA methylase [Luteolibacter sp. LG18]
MDLFAPDPADNLLPRDGIARYHGPVFPAAEADRFFHELRDTVPWRHDEVVMFGKRVVTARLVAWFGGEGLAYTYSGTTKQPLPWTPALLELKARVEPLAGASFNSCLLNLYPSGQEGMGWHSDDESSIARDSPIASLSFGAERRFVFKHKRDGDKVERVLEHGSLLVMAGSTQRHWLHALPKAARITTPRINLTFRVMQPQDSLL